MTTTTETTETTHCPNCNCVGCTEYFIKKSEIESREKQFVRWAWNNSPAEIAQEIRELQEISCAWDDEDEVFEHLEEFFDENASYAIRDILDTVL